MSQASERKAMREILAEHALMSVPDLARLLDVSQEVALGIVERGEVHSVPVGRRRKIDPIDAAVYVLAGREGCTTDEYWKRHGKATAERARDYVRSLKAFHAA